MMSYRNAFTETLFARFVLLMLGFIASPQAADTKFISVGPNFSYSNGDNPDAVLHKGINLAYGYEIEMEELSDRLGTPIGIQAAISFETRGEDSENPEVVYGMRYLQIPLLASFTVEKFSSSGSNSFASLYVGPEGGIYLWRTVSVNGSEIADYSMPDVNRFDAGLSSGFGFGIMGRSMGVHMQANYYHGLVNAIKDDSKTPEDESKDTNHRNIKLLLGLKFKTRW